MSDDVQVIYTDSDTAVQTITIIETGPQGAQGETGETGPTGPQGPPGESVETGSTITCTTAIAMSGHRFVVLDDDSAVYANCTTSDHAHRVVGMTTGASNAGSVSIQTSGEHEEPTWSWTLGIPIFLSTTGLMTQTPPASGFLLIVGFPISATKIYIKIHQPIILT
jgi:hypothetical protein